MFIAEVIPLNTEIAGGCIAIAVLAYVVQIIQGVRNSGSAKRDDALLEAIKSLVESNVAQHVITRATLDRVCDVCTAMESLLKLVSERVYVLLDREDREAAKNHQEQVDRQARIDREEAEERRTRNSMRIREHEEDRAERKRQTMDDRDKDNP